MKDEGTPDRLLTLAEPGSVLGRGLRAAQGRAPSEKEIRALENRLAAALGATALGMAVAAGSTKGAAVTTSAWLSAGAIKVTMAVVVTTALGVGGGVALQRQATAKRQAVRAVAVQGPPHRSVRVSATAAVQEPEAPSPVVVDAPPEKAAHEQQPAPVSVRAAARSSARRATRTGLRSVMPAGEQRPTSVPGDDPTLADELSLIDRAQRALRDDPRRALELAQEHERRYPSQFLEQERDVIEVTALVKLDRRAEAIDRARRFVSRFPGSAHAVRMRAVATSLAR